MLKNYFKIAFQNITINNVYAAINIGDLAIGIAACNLIFLFVKDELSYDRYHSKADRVYRIALLVLMAVLLACPIAWYGMQLWLQDFAYRTPISIWIFVFSGLVALALAICTVSLKAARAAVSDPVLALRTE